MFACVYVCVCYVCVCMYIYFEIKVVIWSCFSLMFTCVYVCVYYVCVCTYIYICKYVHMYTPRSSKMGHVT